MEQNWCDQIIKGGFVISEKSFVLLLLFKFWGIQKFVMLFVMFRHKILGRFLKTKFFTFLIVKADFQKC